MKRSKAEDQPIHLIKNVMNKEGAQYTKYIDYNDYLTLTDLAHFLKINNIEKLLKTQQGNQKERIETNILQQQINLIQSYNRDNLRAFYTQRLGRSAQYQQQALQTDQASEKSECYRPNHPTDGQLSSSQFYQLTNINVDGCLGHDRRDRLASES